MGRASIGYINKDYESIRQELLAKIPQLTDRWTDFNHSDLGVVLLDLFCGGPTWHNLRKDILPVRFPVPQSWSDPASL